jgi:hypothetical protein
LWQATIPSGQGPKKVSSTSRDTNVLVRPLSMNTLTTAYGLEPMNFAKETSVNYDWFVERNDGDGTVWELEALDPGDMLRDLEHVITNVLDMDLFRQEREAEADDLAELQDAQAKAIEALKDFDE